MRLATASPTKRSRLPDTTVTMPATKQLSAITVIGNPTPGQLEEVFELRVRAWRGQARFKADIRAASDRWDSISSHRLLVDDDGRIAGAFRFSLHQALDDLPDGGVWVTDFHDALGPPAYYSRMFVSPEFRGRGLSEQLEALAVSEALRAGALSVTCLAGSVVVGARRLAQMERRGWRVIGTARTPSPDAFWVADQPPMIMTTTRPLL